jgi:transposase
MPPPTLTDDEIAQLRATVERLQRELRVVRTERDLLKERLAAFVRKLFAAKSQARGAEQQDLFLNEAELLGRGSTPAPKSPAAEDDTVSVGAHRRTKRGRRPLDPALPREVVRHELPEAERVCPHDGAALAEIGVEVCEQLDIVPQQVPVIRHERVKYACPRCEHGLRVTPAPARIIPKGLLTESTLAWVVVAKYLDGLPLYRQAALLGRFGGELSHNTLAASVVRVGEAVQPLINLLRDTLLDAPLILGDETTVQVLKEPGRAAAQTKSYVWVQLSGSGPPVRLFAYGPSRGGATARELYAGVARGAALMSDGYEAYDGLAVHYARVHLGCWAHARRHFVEAEQAVPKAARLPDQIATRFLILIGELYKLEARARDLAADERQRLRDQHSRALVDSIAELTAAHLHAVRPESLLGQALHYLSAQWPKLVRFLKDGRYPIDNNACENTIRPFVIGRKNWLFSDTVGGAMASANLYSLIETAKPNGIEPYQYLRTVFTRLPHARTADHYEALLPWRVALGTRDD